MKFSLLELFISGYKFHDGPSIIGDLVAGDLDSDDVTLEPEPDNEFDQNAIKIVLDGYLLGYISKTQNELVGRYLSQSANVSARICEVDETEPDYQKIKIEIYLNL